MNIKKKLYLNSILPVGLVVLIGVVLFGAGRIVADVTKQGRDTASTLTDIFELTALADEYVLNHSQRARQQWHMKHELVGQLLVKLRTDDLATRTTLERMHQGVRDTFERLATSYQRRLELQEQFTAAEQQRAGLTATASRKRGAVLIALQELTAELERLRREASAWREQESLLVGELRAKSQAMVSDGLQLQRRSQEQVATTERIAFMAVFGFVLLMGIGIAITSLLISRSVVRPIARVKQGTEIVARGNLDFRLRIDTRDEIGELARTFDKMMDNLSHTTASRDELNRANEELKHSTTALIQSEKMASMGQMVAGVAHEINTPLAYVRSNVEIVKDQMDETKRLIEAYRDLTQALTAGEDEQAIGAKFNAAILLATQFHNHHSLDEAKDLLARGLNGLDQIRELVVNLKNFSRLDRERVTGFNLNEGLDNVVLLAKPVLKTRAKVVKEYGEIPLVACSPSQINQVFLNIITNAAQAIEADKGGVITIKTATVGDSAQVIIHDNGKGIAAEVLPKVFEPFFTTKKVGEGTGLGLSISRKIVEEHGGSIQVQSAVGNGSSIIITLPSEGAMEIRKSA